MNDQNEKMSKKYNEGINEMNKYIYEVKDKIIEELKYE